MKHPHCICTGSRKRVCQGAVAQSQSVLTRSFRFLQGERLLPFRGRLLDGVDVHHAGLLGKLFELFLDFFHQFGVRSFLVAFQFQSLFVIGPSFLELVQLHLTVREVVEDG